VTNNLRVRPDVKDFHILDIRQPGIDLARFHDFARFAASYSRHAPNDEATSILEELR
jgi:hypothetical protein